LAAFIHAPFNVVTYATSKGRLEADFSDGGFSHSLPGAGSSSDHQYRPIRLYNIHRAMDNRNVEAGSGVYDLDGLCPPLTCPTSNTFCDKFGVEFTVESSTYVRPISPYEFVKCFRLSSDLTYSLSQPANFSLLDCGVPYKTATLLLESVLNRLDSIRAENFELLDPSQHCAPAAPAIIPAYVSGAIGSTLPDNDIWRKSLLADPMTASLIEIASNPSLAEEKTRIDRLHSIYRMPARRGHFTVENGILYMREHLAGDTKFVRLQIVPSSLCNAIFIAFHANPIGGHLNAFRTFHRIRQRFFWPGMYQYVKRLIASCPGCCQSNNTQKRSADLVYSFPIDAPMLVLMVDIYMAGADINFEGNKYYLVAACGMTAFAICEPTPTQNAATFAAALMRIWLRFGFSHTIVVDKDSKFLGVFAETARLLKINLHVLSGENHNPMIVERVNRFLNSSLKIFCNERGTNRVAEEGILMALYAWNSSPVVGTDVSRSLLVTGREFHFPIDFSADQHAILTSNPSRVQSFASEQATLLACGRAIARELIAHNRAYHREYINARRPAPRIYAVGDMVWACRSVRSNKQRGQVEKLMNAWTGPWEVIEKVAGSSYLLKHRDTGKTGKRHAAFLSPFPPQLLPLLPIDGPDNRYGQLHRPISPAAYKNAGIKGFVPTQPMQTMHVSCLATGASDPDIIHFPTLSELNAELDDWDDAEYNSIFSDSSLCIDVEAFSAQSLAPPPPQETPSDPPVPTISELTSKLIASKDKLYFIAHRIPGSTVSEWCLVQINLRDSARQHPPCLQDGKFLADFYVCHPSDKLFNATNQRFWLEYHPAHTPTSFTRQRTAHLIRPSPESTRYAIAEGLAPFRQWIRLTNVSTYIDGPFDFAVVNGRATRDRIALKNWQTLHTFKHLFTNEVPSIDLPEYSVHLSSFHSAISDDAIVGDIVSP